MLDARALFSTGGIAKPELVLLLEIRGRLVGLAVAEVEDLIEFGPEVGATPPLEVPDLEGLISPVFISPAVTPK